MEADMESFGFITQLGKGINPAKEKRAKLNQDRRSILA